MQNLPAKGGGSAWGLPKGAYYAVPDYWHEAADFLNATARDTRTLLFPESSFARQDWGWTRISRTR